MRLPDQLDPDDVKTLKEVRRLYPKAGRHRLIKHSGLSEYKVRKFLMEYTARSTSTVSGALLSENKGCKMLEGPKGGNCRTLEDLLKICKVDLDEWEVERHVINKWEVAIGQKDGNPVHRPLYQVKAWLKKRQCALTAKEAAKMFGRQLVKYSKDQSPIRATPKPKGGILYEICMPDLHLGKLAWHAETGHQDYDSNIACNQFRNALNGLLASAPEKVSRFLFPIGNDFFNVDNSANTTTGGTPQDVDSRYQKSFTRGCEIMIEAIDRMAKIAPVDVVVVVGNHDTQRAYYLGKVLEAWYRNTKGVVIHNSPTVRKYYRYGNVLLGFTHKPPTKKMSLGLVMATERKDFGQCTTKEWHLGHLHTNNVVEEHGIISRILPSLCPPDAWHSSENFVGNRQQAVAFTFDKKNLIGQYYYTVQQK